MYPITPERPADVAAIEPLLDLSFGPDRQQKTVYRLREGVAPIRNLSFAVHDGDRLIGSIRFWPILIGGHTPAILLGPLAVDPARRGEGIGRALVRHGLYTATRLGHRICVLVGDRLYYEPFGFRSAVDAGLELPGRVEPERFQVMELKAGALKGVAGMISKPKATVAKRRRSKAA